MKLIASVLALCGGLMLQGDVCGMALHIPGYSATAIGSFSGVPNAVSIDGGGNLFLAEGAAGILRVTPLGAISNWSSAFVADVAMTSEGAGYGTGGGFCYCLWSLAADGTYSTLHTDSYEWMYVALSTNGTLYASITSPSGRGIYVVDRASGIPTPAFVGGPGPGGVGSYAGMTVGADGKLYTIGSPGLPNWYLYRLDGSSLTQLASLPHGGSNLAQYGSGMFFTNGCSAVNCSTELWVIDPVAGTSRLLADGVGSTGALVYDSANKRLCVAGDDGFGHHVIYAVTDDQVPVRTSTWGALKSHYR